MSPLYRPSGLKPVPLALFVALLVGCDAQPTSSTAPSLSTARIAESGGSLASCPSSASRFASAVIDAHGGVLATGSTVVFIPPYAVRTPTRFTVQRLAGPVLRVRIAAEGYSSYGFARPIAVMIGYAHCERQEFSRHVAVWHVDDETSALLERMPSVNDSRNETVGFITSHLSTYAVAD